MQLSNSATQKLRINSRVLAGLLLASLLGACGGGGSDSPQALSTAPSSAPNGGSSAGYFTVTESHTGWSGEPSTLSIVDAADPSHPKLAVGIDGQGSDYYKTTVAGSVDIVAHTVRFLGAPLLVYLKAGALYQVDLRVGGSATPVRISSESHVCKIAKLHEVAPLGYDAWAEVITAGADGSCTTTADNRTVLVRSNSSTATGGTLLPATSSIVRTFGTGSRPIVGLLVREAVGAIFKMRLYDANMTPGNYVVGSENTNAVNEIYGSIAPDFQPYLIVDKQLKRFTTDGTTASLSSSLYTFTTISTGVVNGTSDGTTVYFVDDAKVMRVAGAAATLLSMLNTGNGSTSNVLQTPTQLVINQGQSISVVPKSGGSVTVLKAGSNVFAYDVSGAQVTYFLATGNNGSGELRSINMNGTNDALIESGVFPAGFVINSNYDGVNIPMFKSMVYCVPHAGDADCRNGTLKSMVVATHATSSLGVFHSSTSLAFFFVNPTFGIDGFPMFIQPTGGTSNPTRWSDAYLVTPDSANSLARVTNLIP